MKLKEKKHKPSRYSVLNDELDHLPIKEVYPKLVEKLKIDLVRASETTLRKLIGECSEDTRLAGYIYVVAKDDYERIKNEFEILMGDWVINARAEIAKRKKNKTWEGGAYTQDVERFVKATVPQYKKVEDTVRKSKRAYKAAEELRNAYEKRLSALQTYARLVEKKIGLSVSQKHEEG
jgi:hypothetical protein